MLQLLTIDLCIENEPYKPDVQARRVRQSAEKAISSLARWACMAPSGSFSMQRSIESENEPRLHRDNPNHVTRCRLTDPAVSPQDNRRDQAAQHLALQITEVA